MTRERRSLPGMVKVLFALDASEWHGTTSESLWSTPLAPDQYRLENIPFYVFDLSLGDTVRAETKDGAPSFQAVVARGGHSTYRLMVAKKNRLDEYWAPLEEMGCTYDKGPAPLLAVDVPADADIYAVYEFLELGQEAGIWDFEEGHCGHELDADASEVEEE